MDGWLSSGLHYRDRILELEILIALCAYSLVSSLTPGPNNLMLMSSGANFGFKRTIPHMLGVSLGFTLMVTLVGLGLMQLFDLYPLSYDILKIFSVAYLLYLAYKIANSAAPEGQSNDNAKPFTFLQAAMFQWVNPKAWAMALTAISVYSPTRSVGSILFVAIVFGAINLPSITVWIYLGQQLSRLLHSQFRLKLFNYGMACLLVASLYPVIIE